MVLNFYFVVYHKHNLICWSISCSYFCVPRHITKQISSVLCLFLVELRFVNRYLVNILDHNFVQGYPLTFCNKFALCIDCDQVFKVNFPVFVRLHLIIPRTVVDCSARYWDVLLRAVRGQFDIHSCYRKMFWIDDYVRLSLFRNTFGDRLIPSKCCVYKLVKEL